MTAKIDAHKLPRPKVSPGQLPNILMANLPKIQPILVANPQIEYYVIRFTINQNIDNFTP